jgi:hypothetical protein
MIGVYVDELVITSSEEMTAAFKMSDLGLLHDYLSIEVK